MKVFQKLTYIHLKISIRNISIINAILILIVYYGIYILLGGFGYEVTTISDLLILLCATLIIGLYWITAFLQTKYPLVSGIVQLFCGTSFLCLTVLQFIPNVGESIYIMLLVSITEVITGIFLIFSALSKRNMESKLPKILGICGILIFFALTSLALIRLIIWFYPYWWGYITEITIIVITRYIGLGIIALLFQMLLLYLIVFLPKE